MKSICRQILYLLAIVAVLASGAGAVTNPADDVLGLLRGNPSDKALLQQLKGSLAGVTNAQERCRLGVIYCLGVLANGDTTEGIAVRAQIAKAFPGNSGVKDLSDQSIGDACAHCTRGKIQTNCQKCGGNGTCATCGGGGRSKTTGFSGQSMLCSGCGGNGKCRTCSGTGRTDGVCKGCGGRVMVLSQGKCQENYLRLLQAGTATVAPPSVADVVPSTSTTATLGNPSAGPSARPPTGLTVPQLPASSGELGAPLKKVAVDLIVPPPPSSPVDPQVTVLFDTLVRKRLAPQLEKIAAYDLEGWKHIMLPPEDKQRLITNQRKKLLSLGPQDVQELWFTAVVRVYRNKPYPGGYTLPSIEPPVNKPDPLVRAIFDTEVEKLLANAMKFFDLEVRSAGKWGFSPSREKRRLDEEWKYLMGDMPRAAQSMWQNAEKQVAEELAEKARRQKEASDREQTWRKSEEERLAKELAEQQKQAVVAEAVRTAMDQAEAQVRRSKLLSRYPITSNDVLRARSHTYTEVQRDRALQELWNRARVNPRNDRFRGFFLPLPRGLPYIVEDVRQTKAGDYIISLKANEARDGKKEDGVVPEGTFEAVGSALGLQALSGQLSYVRLVVPGHDRNVEDFQKKQVVTSEGWIIPVIITDTGRLHADKYTFRTEDELDALSGASE